MQRRRALALIAVLAAAPGLMAAEKKDEKKKGGGITFIQLTVLTATIMRAGGRRGILTVEAGLDIPNEALRAKAESILPRLRAAFVQSLQIYASGMAPETLPNPDILGQILQREADRALGQKGARLLLGAILIN